MSLLTEIQANKRQQGGTCTVRTILKALSKTDRADLDAAMADPSIAATAIARALQARGLQAAPSTVQRHRRGECTCSR